MASDAGDILKVYDRDTATNEYFQTGDTLCAPRLCKIFGYGLTLLYEDPVVRESFKDMVDTEAKWEKLRSHAPVLLALSPSLAMPQSGRDMASCQRGVGPTDAMIFINRDLANALERAEDTYKQRLLSFLCIVTVLHELRHWVRGVVKDMYENSDEHYNRWGVERGAGKPKGESGYLGEHRLWGGILLGGFGFDESKAEIKFSTQAQSMYTWDDIKALGLTKGRQGTLQKLHIYKWAYVCDVVHRMQEGGPFKVPIPEVSYASVTKGAYSPEELRKIMEVDADTSPTLNLAETPAYTRRAVIAVATEARYYPVLQTAAPDSLSPRSRDVSYAVDHPKKTWLRRLFARVLRKDKHKLAFVPMICADVSKAPRSGSREQGGS